MKLMRMLYSCSTERTRKKSAQEMEVEEKLHNALVGEVPEQERDGLETLLISYAAANEYKGFKMGFGVAVRLICEALK